jgi:carbamoyl-phosphate synthase small subunit
VNAILALADGATFRGQAVGAPGEATGEVVFNTSMTGYQEILTDPSYAGQLVCLTYPLIGNYGVTSDDVESRQLWSAGLIVREMARRHSSWRAANDLGSYLRDHGMVAIDEVDTRALTRHLRIHGAQMGVVSTTSADAAAAVKTAQAAPPLEEQDWVRRVECERPYTVAADLPADAPHVVAIDSGAKLNILRQLSRRGCRLTVVPATTPADQIRAMQPDGLFLANGPGDPRRADYLVESVRMLLGGDLPVFGICLGHQILALALGAEIYKLKFGHHGGNHPVLERARDSIAITAQNHGFAVREDSVPAELAVTHINLNDATVEGLAHRERPIFSIQYHPEAAPGPHDSLYLFDQFVASLGMTG